MRVCLFEDHGHINLEPLALMRPVFELLCGQTTLLGKQCRHFAPCEVGVFVRPQLAELYRMAHPRTPVNDIGWLRREPTVLVNGRWLPPAEPLIDLGGPAVALVGDQVAYAVVGPDRLACCAFETIDDCLELWKKTLPAQSAGGHMMNFLWDLLEHNPEQIELDCRQHLLRDYLPPAGRPLALTGPADRLRVDPTAQLDPLVMADTTNGAVVIDAGAVVHAFSRLEGPCYIGPFSHVVGGKIRAGTSIGPHCRIGGEVECSIVQGYSNKYHEGFLGHSYVGEWVNLGAGSQTSDLRNDYGEVKVVVNGHHTPTGSSKVGSFIGDHTKVGLGTLLNTGSNVGIFCNLLPSGTLLPKYIPSFASWWNSKLEDRSDLHAQEKIAAQVMRRRGSAYSEVHATLVRQLHGQTAAERRRMVVNSETRQLRLSA